MNPHHIGVSLVANPASPVARTVVTAVYDGLLRKPGDLLLKSCRFEGDWYGEHALYWQLSQLMKPDILQVAYDEAKYSDHVGPTTWLQRAIWQVLVSGPYRSRAVNVYARSGEPPLAVGEGLDTQKWRGVSSYAFLNDGTVCLLCDSTPVVFADEQPAQANH